MKKNAVILAAGKSSNFAPFTYKKNPKGIFCVKGEILIERHRLSNCLGQVLKKSML